MKRIISVLFVLCLFMSGCAAAEESTDRSSSTAESISSTEETSESQKAAGATELTNTADPEKTSAADGTEDGSQSSGESGSSVTHLEALSDEDLEAAKKTVKEYLEKGSIEEVSVETVWNDHELYSYELDDGHSHEPGSIIVLRALYKEYGSDVFMDFLLYRDSADEDWYVKTCGR